MVCDSLGSEHFIGFTSVFAIGAVQNRIRPDFASFQPFGFVLGLAWVRFGFVLGPFWDRLGVCFFACVRFVVVFVFVFVSFSFRVRVCFVFVSFRFRFVFVSLSFRFRIRVRFVPVSGDSRIL